MNKIGTCHHIQELRREVMDGAITRTCVIELAGVASCLHQEFIEILVGRVRAHVNNERVEGEGGDHCNVFDGIKGRVLAERCLRRIATGDQKQGVTIGLRFGHQVRSHTATATDFVVHNDGGANGIGEFLCNKAGHDIG